MYQQLLALDVVFIYSLFHYTGIHLSKLNPELKERTPPGYELYGYEKLQNQMFARYPSIYNYHKCRDCGYSVPAYGKPYSILLRPTINDTIPDNTVIMVCTQPSERHLRDLFRRVTESQRRYYNIAYFFALTQDPKIANCTDVLKEEQSQFHDLLVFDHPNSYHNLVLTVLFSFHYLQSLELSSRYIVKVDADVALNIPRLMRQIYQPKYMKLKNVYLGDCRKGHFNTEFKTKKYIPAQIVGKTVIKRYARGGLYVLSRETLTPLLIGVRHSNVITHLEDVTAGNALYRMGIRCVKPVKEWIARNGCLRKQCAQYVSIHPYSSSEETERFYRLLLG